MIIHNRGHGVQIEDALVVDRITGHYRYRGAPSALAAKTSQAATRLALRSPSLSVRASEAPFAPIAVASPPAQ